MPETNCKIESTLVTLALRKNMHFFFFCAIRVVFSDPITYSNNTILLLYIATSAAKYSNYRIVLLYIATSAAI